MFIKQIVKHGSWIMSVGVVVVLCLQFLVSPAYAQPAQQASMTVFATGLTNPRGLTFGPDGYLYVAEGGPATNSLSTIGQCDQVPDAGPYTGGFNSRILKISPDGSQSTVVAQNLPSSQTNPDLGSLVSGVADLAFVGDTLYGIEAGAGCSHGLAGTDNTVFRVNPDGSTTTIADLSQFVKANPVAKPNDEDFEPDGTWYSMLSIGGTLYAVEPNHGELDRILLNGQVQRVVDISASQGHIVPTAFAFYKGDFYVGNLNPFPVNPGSSQIMKINNGGKVKSITRGLTTVLGIAFDAQGRMYVLETDTVAGFPGPDAAGSGTVVRVNGDGTLTTIASGMVFPTAMTYGPDGALYVSNFGFGVPVNGAGQIVRIAINE
jgi:sugar lactone lactonase YvrE